MTAMQPRAFDLWRPMTITLQTFGAHRGAGERYEFTRTLPAWEHPCLPGLVVVEDRATPKGPTEDGFYLVHRRSSYRIGLVMATLDAAKRVAEQVEPLAPVEVWRSNLVRLKTKAAELGLSAKIEALCVATDRVLAA